MTWRLPMRRRRPAPARPRPRSWSLRGRLLWTVMGTSVGLWLVSLGVVMAVSWFAASDIFDDALEEGSRLVLQLGVDGEGHAPDDDELRSGRGEELRLRMYYQLVDGDGRVLLRADDTPRAAFVADGARSRGYATVWADGELWRVHVRRGEGGITAQVGQPMDERLDLLEDLAVSLAWPALAMLLVLGLLCWVLIRRLLRPLDDAALRIGTKSPQDLSPVHADNPPRELQPMLDAINVLLARLATALDSERRFTSDAAHELRTPLAALRMRVQLIERELQLPSAHLQQLRADVDRCTALIESLLALARLEPQAEPLKTEPVSLATVLDTVTAGRAEAGRIERELAVPTVQAAPVLLASALRNLIDNALRYGAANGRVRVSATPLADGGVRLAVRDDGPGVSAAERARLGERFFRVLGTGQAGNGMGLSIVVRIAALHEAPLRFEQGLDGRGLGVVIDFPPAHRAS